VFVLNVFRVCSAALMVASVVAATACGSSAASNRAATGGGRGRGGRGGEGGAVPVVTAKVVQKDVPVQIAAIGNVEAYETVSVRSQVTGVVTEVRLREGDFVKAGDHLFTIDPRPFQALLEQAQANLTRDQALLAQAQAQLARDQAQAEYQRTTSDRNNELVERGIISKDAAQQSEAAARASAATVKADQAAVESANAQLAAQQAAVDNARVQLAYTVIRSAINGRTGSITAKPGNLATANVTELTNIAQVEPVFVTFAVPGAHLQTIKSRMARESLRAVATPQDDEATSVEGELVFVDNSIDPATDTIKLKARFDNHDRRLWPGQFSRVSLRLTTLSNATVVSNEAVQTGQDGQFVFVVKPDSTVEQRPVTVAQRVDEDVVVASGLQPGETVVTEGQLRLEPGSRIQTSDGRGADAGRAGRGGRGRGGR
jgi:multidrug efflux system membrane fusion protein